MNVTNNHAYVHTTYSWTSIYLASWCGSLPLFTCWFTISPGVFVTIYKKLMIFDVISCTHPNYIFTNLLSPSQLLTPTTTPPQVTWVVPKGEDFVDEGNFFSWIWGPIRSFIESVLHNNKILVITCIIYKWHTLHVIKACHHKYYINIIS